MSSNLNILALAVLLASGFLFATCSNHQVESRYEEPTPTDIPKQDVNNIPATLTTHEPVFLIEGSEFKNTQGPVYSHAWSPDGMKLASASQDNSVRIWDSQVFTQMALLNTGFAFCVDWSPDGATLAVGNYGGQVQLYDTWTWDLIQEYSDIQTQAVINLDWSPDGSRVLAGGLSGKVVVGDVQTAQPVLTMNGYTTARSDANGVAWSPDGLILASAHQDGILRLWDAQNGDLRLEIPAHNGWARGLAWSPDSRILASSGEDRRAALWDIANGVMLGDIFHNFLPVWSVGISPSGNVMTSGSGAYAESRPGVVISWRVE